MNPSNRSASRTVKFADLNISNPSGAHALYVRIEYEGFDKASTSVYSLSVFINLK